MADALVPVFTGTIADRTAQLCCARTLHTFMQVRRDFSNWIKGRIRKFGFTMGEDFITISRSPELASGNRGAATDYHLTLDMAKELAMVENNEQGRAARRYFIECERQALAMVAPQPEPIQTTLDYDRISTAQAQDLKEIINAIVAAKVHKTHGEAWARFQNKFRVNSYLELPATRHLEARQYLIAKLPGGYQGDMGASTVNDMVAEWVRKIEEPNGYPAILFMPLVQAVQRKMGRTRTLPAGQMLVDRNQLAAIYTDLGKLRSRIDAMGMPAQDTPPSWWQQQTIGA